MNENRRKILEMLAAGQITAEEAERLIAALEKEQGSTARNPQTQPKVQRKYVRVLVEAENEHTGDHPAKVNIRVPIQLLRAGVRLASLIPAHARDRVNDALR